MADGQRSQIGCQPHGHPWSDVCFVCSASTSKVQDHRDRVLSEGRREVGIWSSYGVKEWHHSGIEEGTLGELEISRNHILDSRKICLYVCTRVCGCYTANWYFNIYLYIYTYLCHLCQYSDESSPQIAGLGLEAKNRCPPPKVGLPFYVVLVLASLLVCTWFTEVQVIHDVNPCCCFIMCHLCLALFGAGYS